MVSEETKREKTGKTYTVLILIVVEYGLGVDEVITLTISAERLNPYCSGIWSRSWCRDEQN